MHDECPSENKGKRSLCAKHLRQIILADVLLSSFRFMMCSILKTNKLFQPTTSSSCTRIHDSYYKVLPDRQARINASTIEYLSRTSAAHPKKFEYQSSHVSLHLHIMDTVLYISSTISLTTAASKHFALAVCHHLTTLPFYAAAE